MRSQVFVGERHAVQVLGVRPTRPRSRRAARRAGPPWRRRRPRSGSDSEAPCSISYTPGWAIGPDSVTSAEPGWLGVPSWRNQPAPWRAISATWASVSTLLTSVGRRRTPCSNGIGGVNVGFAGPPFEVADERRLLPGDVVAGDDHHRQPRRAAGAPGAPARSSIARRCCRCRRRATRRRTTITSSAPTASAASTAAVEHQVGQRLEQRAVLEARRLALGGVDDDDRASAARRRRRASWSRSGTPRRRGRAGRRARSPRSGPRHARARGAGRALAAPGRGPWTSRCSASVIAPRSGIPSEQPRQRRAAARCRAGPPRSSRAGDALIASRSQSTPSRRDVAEQRGWACPSGAPIPSPAGRPAATARGTARTPRRRRARSRSRRGSRASREHAREHAASTTSEADDADRQQPGAFTSLPVPRPCSSAIGQLA